MSDQTPDPFGLFDLGALFGSGGDPWRRAADIAASIAAGGQSEANVDPAQRIQVADLVRVAELNVDAHPLVDLDPTATVEAVTRADWARRSLTTYRPFLERFTDNVGAESEAYSRELDEIDSATEADDPMARLWSQMLHQLIDNFGPMLIISMAGSMVGHLGQQALGTYDLPVPRPQSELLVVPSAVAEATTEWGTDPAETMLWLLTSDLVTHAVLRHPHVGGRLESLVLDHASAFVVDPERIAGALDLNGLEVDPNTGMPDMTRLGELSSELANPDRLLGAMATPAQDLLRPQFDALLAAITGFVDHVTTQIMVRLSSDPVQLRDRFRRRVSAEGDADRFMSAMLGIELSDDLLGRGERFIGGIVERAGDDALVRLWGDELDLPTAAEIDAPGLWLARIGLGDDPVEFGEIPDDLSGLDEL